MGRGRQTCPGDLLGDYRAEVRDLWASCAQLALSPQHSLTAQRRGTWREVDDKIPLGKVGTGFGKFQF